MGTGGIRGEIADEIRKSGDGFSALALRLFAAQFAGNAPYRAYCESLGVSPKGVSAWEDIPAIPADAFKLGLPLATFPVEEAVRIFLTSGTTGEVRGRHAFPELDTYTLSIRRGWKDAGLPESLRPLILSRSPVHFPESSLTFMFETLAASHPSPLWLLDDDGALRSDLLESAIGDSEPVLLFSTAIGLWHLFEALTAPQPLPPGSWIFTTGGYKGLARETNPEDLSTLAASLLDVAPQQIINEYGMTELSSQCYATGPDQPHRTPPWMRVRVIDPETGREQPHGEAGYIVFYDLANVGSVLAVRTQDFGRAIDHRTFHLEGRDPGALPRGCSRASDSALFPLPRP